MSSIAIGGFEVLFDEEDREIIEQHKWHIAKNRYVTAWGNGSIILLHRLIALTPAGLSTDHANGNPLDNRRCNLRVCTRSQNLHNRAVSKNKTSCAYKGVYKQRDRWRVQIRINGKKIHVGMYDTPEDARDAYLKEEIRAYGEFSRGVGKVL